MTVRWTYIEMSTFHPVLSLRALMPGAASGQDSLRIMRHELSDQEWSVITPLLAKTNLAFVKLAPIRLWLRVYAPRPRSFSVTSPAGHDSESDRLSWAYHL